VGWVQIGPEPPPDDEQAVPGPGDDATTDSSDAPEGAADPLRFSSWMKRSTTGAVLTGIALGLQHALEKEREQPAFVMEAPGEPDEPEGPIALHFDPDDPGKTVAVIRARSEDRETGPADPA
jgi:hypothetical protein